VDATAQSKTIATRTGVGQSLRHYPVPEADGEPDWLAITLGILAVISLLGLIPLWYAVLIRYTG
jgi:hypothetical protein